MDSDGAKVVNHYFLHIDIFKSIGVVDELRLILYPFLV